MTRRRVLLLAQDCNPEWPSLPVVGYKYARALAEVADVTVATHIRNKPNVEAAGEMTDIVHYVDNEWLAGPMYRLAKVLRRGSEVAWSVNQAMAYLPYLSFERQAWRHFRKDLKAGKFDIVHRITPMSPTLPSYMATKSPQPFVLGPLNGNLGWPKQFMAEQKREREGFRKLREIYHYMPYARASQRKSACILAAFQHTIDDLKAADPEKIIWLPEIGFDPAIFNAEGRKPPLSGDGPKRFLYAGRLVPYKLPEVAIRAFANSEKLKAHKLHVLGSGPELERLQAMVREAGAEDRVIFEGNKSQAEVADFMRACDVFVFPSIRELGAGVVIEAMASNMVLLVANYGAPGDLVGPDRGVRIDMADLESLVTEYRGAMERCVDDPATHAAMATRAHDYAHTRYPWPIKAEYTLKIYDAVLAGAPLTGFTEYR